MHAGALHPKSGTQLEWTSLWLCTQFAHTWDPRSSHFWFVPHLMDAEGGRVCGVCPHVRSQDGRGYAGTFHSVSSLGTPKTEGFL